ncbi:hypothetical protein BDV10DRAFT_130645 [Aspergillus recurvatus]
MYYSFRTRYRSAMNSQHFTRFRRSASATYIREATNISIMATESLRTVDGARGRVRRRELPRAKCMMMMFCVTAMVTTEDPSHVQRLGARTGE